MKKIIIVCLLLSLSGWGCAFFESKTEKSSDQLTSLGMEAFSEGDYREAIEHFQKLKDWYPFSKFAILAELKIADSHYYLKEYEDAIFAYEEFENLHPRNDAMPYVVYQIGLCNFERIDTVDRDQTTARKALESFQRLKKSYPNDPYTQKAEANIFKCNSSLAGHEFYVGLFYFKSKHYKAAISRFKTVLTEYPDVGIHKEAMEYIARCEAKLPDTPADPALTMQGGNKEGMNGIQ